MKLVVRIRVPLPLRESLQNWIFRIGYSTFCFLSAFSSSPFKQKNQFFPACRSFSAGRRMGFFNKGPSYARRSCLREALRHAGRWAGRLVPIKQKSPHISVRASLINVRRRLTLPDFTPVPSARAGLTTLFGMGRGGPHRNSHLNVVVIFSVRRLPTVPIVPIAIGIGITLMSWKCKA